MPDQRAMLWWSNGLERLVIETRMVGEGTNFAWVVPLPAVPKIEAASQGLFPTLTGLLQPRVIHTPTEWWRVGTFLGGFIWLLLTVHPTGRTRWTDWAAITAMGFGVAGVADIAWSVSSLFVVATATYCVIRGRTRGIRWHEVILVGLMTFLLIGFLLPSLATAKGGSSREPIEILDRQLAGVFDSTTITGKDPAALRSWLNSQGYSIPAAAEPVIEDYLRDGWVFVASQVRRDQSVVDPTSLHPLSFTFPSKEPVYPLRLTGVENGNLELDLFVFGPNRARVHGLSVRDCREPYYPPDPSSKAWWFDAERLPIFHEALRQSAPAAACVTRLQGALTPQQMRHDATVQWEEFTLKLDTRFSSRGAWTCAANWTLNGFGLFAVGVASVARLRGSPIEQHLHVVGAGSCAALAATAIIHAALPVVPVTLQSHRAIHRDTRDAAYLVRFAIQDELDTNQPITVESVRAAIQRGLPFHEADHSRSIRRAPTFRIREEDSPFNYSLRKNTNGVELLLYDQLGRAEVIRLPE